MPGTPMPQKLWAAAAKAAQRHGVYRTTHTLGLEYNKLKSMVQRPDDTPARSGAAQFVELAAPALAGGPQCRIEVEGPAGARMKIELPALASAELVVGLCQTVWGITR